MTLSSYFWWTYPLFFLQVDRYSNVLWDCAGDSGSAPTKTDRMIAGRRYGDCVMVDFYKTGNLKKIRSSVIINPNHTSNSDKLVQISCRGWDRFPHCQLADPGTDPMDSPHPRIQCRSTNPVQRTPPKDSHPEPVIDHTLASSRTRIDIPLVITRTQRPWHDPPRNVRCRQWIFLPTKNQIPTQRLQQVFPFSVRGLFFQCLLIMKW